MNQQQTSAQKKPSHGVFRVQGDGEDAYWTRIGAGWTHKDGKGLTLKLDAMPIEGRIVIRLDEPREDEADIEPPPRRKPAAKRPAKQ